MGKKTFVPSVPDRYTEAVKKPFFMEVDDIFTITGRGPVATGTIKAGVANTGDKVEIIGQGSKKLTATITGVEMFRKILDRGEAGDNVGILLRGVDKDDIKAGMFLIKPGSVSLGNIKEDNIEAISYFTELINMDPGYAADAYCWRGNVKKELKDFQGAYEDYSKANETDSKYRDSYYQKAQVCRILNNITEAVKNYKKAFSLTTDYSEQTKIKQELESLIPQFNNQFVELPYQQRKIIVVDDEHKTAPSEAFVVLDKGNLPQTLKFPVGHPLKGELYIGHPFIKEIYTPYSIYETNLFRDRFEEFSYFVQCMGAKAMTIKVVKGSESSFDNNNRFSENRNSENSLGGSAGYVGFGLNLKETKSNTFEGSQNNQQGGREDILTSYSRNQTFKPTKKPYIPSDLIWFANEPSWQRLYHQRITGNIMRHHDLLSSKSSYSLSEKEESSLKSAFKTFITGGLDIKMFNASGEYSNNSDNSLDELVEKTFSQSETIEWEIEIEFESIENLLEDNIQSEPTKKIADVSSISNKEEEEYLEEAKFMLEDDGIIDDKERAILDRFRERKGISNERAIELEKNLLSFGDLSEDEKEYLEEFKEILNEGEITEKERRILNRMANRLGISEERIIQLEGSIRQYN